MVQTSLLITDFEKPNQKKRGIRKELQRRKNAWSVKKFIQCFLIVIVYCFNTF
jgi:hypothetical protein